MAGQPSGARFHVFAPDRRGHGRIPDVDGPITQELMAQDTVAFIETVVGEPAHLVGRSDGTPWHCSRRCAAPTSPTRRSRSECARARSSRPRTTSRSRRPSRRTVSDAWRRARALGVRVSAQGVADRLDALERLEILVVEGEVRRGEVLLEVRDRRSARDEEHAVVAVGAARRARPGRG